jgi:tetratricopeptide (TPR) repeat protein
MADPQQLLLLVEEAVSRLSGARPGRWMRRLEESFDAITAGLRECLDRGDAETGLHLAAAVGKYWWMSGRAAAGRHWLEALLDQAGGVTSLRSRARLTAAGAAYALADYPAAISHLEQARLSADPAQLPGIVNQLGMVAREQCRFEEARALHQESRRIFEEAGDKVNVAWCVSNLGVVAFREGDLPLAKALHNDALDRRRDCADQRDIASSLGNLATVARVEGRLDIARQYHEAVLQIRETLNDRWGVAGSQLNLALVASCRGEHDLATNLLAKAEPLFREIGDRLGLCECHDARVLFAAHRSEPVADLLAVAEKVRADIGAPHAPVFLEELRHLTSGRKPVR